APVDHPRFGKRGYGPSESPVAALARGWSSIAPATAPKDKENSTPFSHPASSHVFFLRKIKSVVTLAPVSQKLPISVCILTKNEEENLVRTLPPLDRFAEILVFDSGSTDRSIEMCQEAGAVIHEVEWEGFGTTRRKLFEAASQPWILWLDADEVITAPLLEEITDLFQSPPEKIAYSINRIVYFEGKWIRHGEWFPDWVMRLFPADSWEMIELDVHESVKISCPKAKLNGLIEHYSFRDWEDLEKRSEKYAALWAGQRSRTQKKPPSNLSIAARSWVRFLKGYLLKRGFLDGTHGFKIAKSRAAEVRLKYGLWKTESK
ncbi:MAG: glycosyltransferase family 2 protein, partial [Verrucomicrobiales bacterium]|nr:glycosyltransferase family 2 protein [Verrucomicrobiales bacterium]